MGLDLECESVFVMGLDLECEKCIYDGVRLWNVYLCKVMLR